MFDAGAIVGKLTLDTRSWDLAIDKVKADTASLKKLIQDNEQRIKNLGRNLTIAGAAITAVSGLIVKSAADEQTIYSRLEQQLKNVGYGYSGASEEVKAFAAAMQNATTYGDEEIAQLVTELLPYTGDLKKSFEGVKIAVDLAAAGVFDLSTASRYVGMAMSGNVEMLGRYIPELRQGDNAQLDFMTSSEKAAYALDLLKSKFGGMAEKDTKTLNGAMTRLKNSVGDLAETLGNNLLPIITPIVDKIRDIVINVTKWAQSHQLLSTILLGVVAVIGVVATAFGALLLILPNLVMGFSILAPVLVASLPILGAIAAAAAAVWLAFKYWEELKALFWSFAAGVNYALAAAVKSIAKFISWGERIPFIGSKFKAVSETLKDVSDGFKEAADLSEQRAAEIISNIEQKKNALADGIKDTVDTIKGKLNESAGVFDQFFAKFSSGFKSSLDKSLTDMRDWAQMGAQAASDMISAMETVTGDFFYDVLKGQLKTAQDYFVAFGDMVLKILAETMARIMVVKALTGIGSMFFGGSTAGVSTIAGSSFNTSGLSLGGFATGIDYVPESGVYKLHEGEKVTPKYDATKESGGNVTVINYVTSDAINAAIAQKPDTVINVINSDTVRNGITRKTYKRYG